MQSTRKESSNFSITLKLNTSPQLVQGGGVGGGGVGGGGVGGGMRSFNQQVPSTVRTKIMDFLLLFLPLSIVQLIWQFAPFFIDGNDSASPEPPFLTIFFSKSVSRWRETVYTSDFICDRGQRFIHNFYVVHSFFTVSTPEALEKVNGLRLDDMNLGKTTGLINSTTGVDRNPISVAGKWTVPKRFVVLIPSELFAKDKSIQNFSHSESVEALKGRNEYGYLVLEVSVFFNLVRKNQLSADVSTITKVESTHHSSLGFKDNSRAMVFFNTKKFINDYLGVDFYTSQHVSIYETVTLRDGIEIKRHGLPAAIDPRCFHEKKTLGMVTGFTSSFFKKKRKFDDMNGDEGLGGGDCLLGGGDCLLGGGDCLLGGGGKK
jgi:hypothetical protein